MDIEDHRRRSAYMQRVIQRTGESAPIPAIFANGPCRTIVLFWDNLERLPDDVSECIESWKPLEAHGFSIRLFDSNKAQEFIASHLSPRHETAYRRCYHPAMQSDYFRLCYIVTKGGCYVDADDVYKGSEIEHLFGDGRLKIQPLCYDNDTDQMVSPEIFTDPDAESSGWTFYFNNNPLIAAAGHPIIHRALENATAAIEQAADGELPEIQSTTGPGNLTRSFFELAQQSGVVLNAVDVLINWTDVASSRWPLSYRRDTRNWRLSNRREFNPSGKSHR